MKPILILITFTFLSFNLLSQQWAPTGATWTYNYYNPPYQGYTQIKYIDDTLIAGENAKVMSSTIYTYNNQNGAYQSTQLDTEYTFENNNIVYLLTNNIWDTLFNFNTVINSGWVLPRQTTGPLCDSNLYMHVVSTGQTLLSGQIFNFLDVEYSFVAGQYANVYQERIVPKIGSIDAYMFPYTGCGCPDCSIAGALRCYSDSSFFYQNPDFYGACEFVTYASLPFNELNLEVEIYPNPTSNTLFIKGLTDFKDVNYSITDLSGKEIKSSCCSKSIVIEELHSGVYFLRIEKEEEFLIKKFIKE